MCLVRSSGKAKNIHFCNSQLSSNTSSSSSFDEEAAEAEGVVVLVLVLVLVLAHSKYLNNEVMYVLIEGGSILKLLFLLLS